MSKVIGLVPLHELHRILSDRVIKLWTVKFTNYSVVIIATITSITP